MAGNIKLHIATARGAIATVQSLDYVNQVKAIGINEQEWDRLTGNKPWAAVERPVIERLIKHLLFGMCDMMGIPRFELPAEFVAGVGVSFINPVNYWAFSGWVGSHAKAEDLGNFDGARVGPIEGLEKVRPSQVFALMIELKSDQHLDLMCRRFAEKCGISLATTEVYNEEKKS